MPSRPTTTTTGGSTNGTSTSNKVVTNAVLKRGDLVLFDRNNHKSLHQGALVGAGAIPMFLPTARNAFGMIGPAGQLEFGLLN